MSGSPRHAAGRSSEPATEWLGTTSASVPSDASVAAMLNELLRRAYLSAPSDLAEWCRGAEADLLPPTAR